VAIFFDANVVHTFDCVGFDFIGANVVQYFSVGFSVIHTLDFIVGGFVVQALVVNLVVHDFVGFSVVHDCESQLLKS